LIRQEIEFALQRDIPVIPVLLEGTPPPDAQALPSSIQALARRQGLELSDSRWHDDLARLERALSHYVEPLRPEPPEPPPPPPPPQKTPWWKTRAGIGAIAAGVMIITIINAAMQTPSDTVVPIYPRPESPPGPVVSTPDATGTWMSATGNTYVFAQQGHQLQVQVARAGRGVFAQGNGTIGPAGMQFSVMAQLNPNLPPALTNCQLEVGADWRSYSGTCSNAAGSFAESISR
jgi:hypothetical protein